jgi:hypothetical protein
MQDYRHRFSRHVRNFLLQIFFEISLDEGRVPLMKKSSVGEIQSEKEEIGASFLDVNAIHAVFVPGEADIARFQAKNYVTLPACTLDRLYEH